MTEVAQPVSPLAGIHASAPQTLPFAKSLEIRAFVLERERGNLLVYSTSNLAPPRPGGVAPVARHYLNHWHEAMFASESIVAPRFCHAAERARVEKSYAVRGTFSRRHMLDEDFEVIPTPGHTAGATAFLWDRGEHRLLFTGDTVYLRGGEWVAAVLESSDREAYLETLELIAGLEFDVLVPWAAERGGPYYAMTTAADTRRRIDAIRERVARGEDH